jgi:hypothetical protein
VLASVPCNCFSVIGVSDSFFTFIVITFQSLATVIVGIAFTNNVFVAIAFGVPFTTTFVVVTVTQFPSATSVS